MISQLNALPVKAGVAELTPGTTDLLLKRLPGVSSLSVHDEKLCEGEKQDHVEN